MNSVYKNLSKTMINDYFNYIVERQLIWYRRRVLKLNQPWTDNEILRRYHFCNNFRELDITTRHLFKNLLNNCGMHTKQEILFNIVIFRVFNTRNFFDTVTIPMNPDHFDREKFVSKLDKISESGENLFSPAYIISQQKIRKDYPGIKHLQFSFMFEELAKNINNFTERLSKADPPDEILNIITELPNVGPFLGYQILLDLAYTDFFENRFTEDDFIVIGPGAEAGIKWIYNGEKHLSESDCIKICYYLRDVQKNYLDLISKPKGYGWKQITFNKSVTYPYLSLSAIEFCLCEFNKYNKRKNNTGSKRFYKGYKEKGLV